MRMKRMKAVCLLLLLPSPGQSLGANIIIVQVGEDVGDDAALLLGPLNHLVFFSFVQGLRENAEWFLVRTSRSI